MGRDYIQLTLFQEDSPASHFLMPGSAEARKMTVTSGQKWLGLSRNSGPLGLLEKMLLESSIWHSTQCFLTWRAKDTPHGHFLYQLQVSMPRTSDTGQRLWPTPKAAIRGDCPSERKRRSPDLSAAVRMFPTPTAQDFKHRKMYPTPTAQDARNSTFPESQIGRDSLAGGTDEGAVCNTAGQGLSDRSSKKVEEFRAEQESERPNCRRGEPDGSRQWAVEPNVGRVAHGIPNRVDRIKCLGNAVVPQQFYPIFKAIAEIEMWIQN